VGFGRNIPGKKSSIFVTQRQYKQNAQTGI